MTATHCDHVDSGTAYVAGCRSDTCRKAHRDRIYRRRAERRALRRPDETGALVIPPMAGGPWHGLASTYRNWGCRCRPCVDANTADCRYYKQRRRALKNGSDHD